MSKTNGSTLACPNCGFQKTEEMPTDSCVFFWECESCKEMLKPLPGDCCVYCSYGSVACPPKTHYQIDKQILSEIGRLTSTRGSNLTARKANASGDLLANKRDWLERAIPKIILRIAESEAGISADPMHFDDV